MKKSDYPSWLVSVEQAKKLRELSFNEETFIYVCIDKDTNEIVSGFLPSLSLYDNLKGIRNSDLNKDTGLFELCIPTFEQVLEWFINKGFIGTVVCFRDASLNKPIYIFEIKDKKGYLISSSKNITEKYEKAREELINKLIELYGNNI